MGEVCTWLMIDNSEYNSGKDCSVELDKSDFSKRKSNRAKKASAEKVENRNSC